MISSNGDVLAILQTLIKASCDMHLKLVSLINYDIYFNSIFEFSYFYFIKYELTISTRITQMD